MNRYLVMKLNIFFVLFNMSVRDGTYYGLYNIIYPVKTTNTVPTPT